MMYSIFHCAVLSCSVRGAKAHLWDESLSAVESVKSTRITFSKCWSRMNLNWKIEVKSTIILTQKRKSCELKQIHKHQYQISCSQVFQWYNHKSRN